MKLLVADDDAIARAVLRAFLKEHHPALVLEAPDGLEALAAVHRDAPDGVFLDLSMPVVDGLEVLEALRADPTYRRLPVVVMSAMGDQATVRRAIALGILDYLVKPFRPIQMQDRVLRALVGIEQRRRTARAHRPPGAARAQADPGRSNGRPRILLVDRDLNFRTFFTGLFDQEYEINQTASSVEGLRAVGERLPEVVCLGEGLSLPNERWLARKIRQLDPAGQTEVYLLAETPELAETDRELFHGVLRRSFVPESFRRAFASARRGLAGGGIPAQILDEALQEEVVGAARHTIGVTAGQEVAAVELEAANPPPVEVTATVPLTIVDPAATAWVGVGGTRADVERLAASMLGAPVTLDEGAGDALGEIANTVAGRLVATLEARGLRATLGLPAVQLAEAKASPAARQIALRTDGGMTFVVQLGVEPVRTTGGPA